MKTVRRNGYVVEWATKAAVFREQKPLNRKLEEVLVVALPIKKLWKLKEKEFQ